MEYNPVQFCMVSFAQLCGHDQFYQSLTYIFQGGVWIELQSINWFSAFALTYIFIYFLRNRVQYPRWAEGFAKQSLKRRHWKFHVYGWWTVGLVLFTNYIAIKWFLLKIYITTVDGTVILKFLIQKIFSNYGLWTVILIFKKFQKIFRRPRAQRRRFRKKIFVGIE